jgi:hypothetical protein
MGVARLWPIVISVKHGQEGHAIYTHHVGRQNYNFVEAMEIIRDVPTTASTLSGFWRVVLPCTPAMLGPKIEWALVMWSGLTGQFLIELFLNNFRN